MPNVACFKWAQAMRLRAAAFPGIVHAHWAIVGVVYLAGYVALDRVSFIEPYASFGITPWNPNTGLSFVLVLVFGQRMIPFLFIGPFLADLVNGTIIRPWSVEILSVAVIGGGYSAALVFLQRSNTRFDPALSSTRDLVVLMLVAAASAAFVASSYVGLTIAAGLLTPRDFMAAALRYWIGDVIGILALTPFALFALTRRRILPLSMETALQCAAVVCALMLVFGIAEEREFQLFYVLFLPIVWMAVRNGTEGVSAGILITQLGVILGARLLSNEREELIAFQALMLVLAVTGLIAGALVTERRRMESQLRLHQESLARLARLGSIGELAAAVAHEVNQPLMAAGTYIRLVADIMSSRRADAGEVAEIAKKAVAQVDRAAEVIRRLRALVRLDRSNRAPFPVERLVKQAIELCRPDLDRANVTASFRQSANLPPVMVDILQIEQVLVNLMRNSVEAIGDSGSLQGAIRIAAKPADKEFVEVCLVDSGPGFPRERIENGFLPLYSSKADGLGVGLPLCRSIVEAHGGRLWLDAISHGASIRFTLPIATKSEHG
ncbi:MAG TPA: MASE1 domain-containing protein [Roseiarcus sp.]|nr:MASE1 domain-containing protein [Roseiarcus sp.]